MKHTIFDKTFVYFSHFIVQFGNINVNFKAQSPCKIEKITYQVSYALHHNKVNTMNTPIEFYKVV